MIIVDLELHLVDLDDLCTDRKRYREDLLTSLRPVFVLLACSERRSNTFRRELFKQFTGVKVTAEDDGSKVSKRFKS